MDLAVCRKRELFQICKQSQKEECKEKHCETEKDAKRAVYIVINQKA